MILNAACSVELVIIFCGLSRVQTASMEYQSTWLSYKVVKHWRNSNMSHVLMICMYIHQSLVSIFQPVNYIIQTDFMWAISRQQRPLGVNRGLSQEKGHLYALVNRCGLHNRNKAERPLSVNQGKVEVAGNGGIHLSTAGSVSVQSPSFLVKRFPWER